MTAATETHHADPAHAHVASDHSNAGHAGRAGDLCAQLCLQPLPVASAGTTGTVIGLARDLASGAVAPGPAGQTVTPEGPPLRT